LLVGTTPGVINAVERMRTYGSIHEVSADFGSTTEEFLGAQAWFSQNPSPTSLNIGRWVNTPSAGALIGAALPTQGQSIGQWALLANGYFGIAFDGAATPVNVGPVNCTTPVVTTMNGVATAVQNALRLVVGGGQATCVWNQNYQRFEIRSGTTGTTSNVSFLTTPSPMTGVDISGPPIISGTPPTLQQVGLAMNATSGAYAAPGQAAETAVTAVTILDQKFSAQWYAVVVPSALDVAPNFDIEAVAAYVEATGIGANTPHYFGVTSWDTNCMSALSTTDIAWILFNYGYNKSAVQYSTSNHYAIMSYLARILTTQWRGQNTTITLMYKQEPGVAPENVSTTQANALMNKNCNAIVNYANGARLIEYGTSASGEFTDTIIGADALALDLQNSIFNVLYTSPTKVPQTDPGMELLKNAASATCSGYAANGWLGAGTWNAQGFGTLKTGDLLPSGFYVFAPSMLTQDQGDRAARRAPLMQIAAKTAGAIHTASVVVFVNQ
jgi:hypothetical protein